MMIDVILFARARQLVGRDSAAVEVPEGGTVEELTAALIDLNPELKPLLPNLLVAVNNQFANNDTVVRNTDTVACFPPVSGG